MIRKYKLQNKGFTLIETIIYIGIIGTVVVAFITFSLSIGGNRNKAFVGQETQANARTAMDLMSQKIRMASDVVSPVASTTESILELDMPVPDPNIIFRVISNRLNLIESGVSTTTITSSEVNVTNLTFTNMSSVGERDNIKINMTAEYDNASGDVEFEFSQTLETSVSVRQ
jgi:type II secretory pathway pseudopilin PulG